MVDTKGPRDALALLALVVRSWRIVMPLLAVTAGVTFLVTMSVPVHYKATAKVILEAPRSVTDQSGVVTGADNPLAQFNPSLAIVGDVLAQVVDEDAARDALGGEGATGSYTIASSDLWDAPVLLIEAVSRDPSEATLTVQLVADAVKRELVNQQTAAGAHPDTFLTLRTLVAPAEGQRLYGGRVRSGLACLSVGVGLTIGLTLLVDARRRARLAARFAAPPPDPPRNSSMAAVGAPT